MTTPAVSVILPTYNRAPVLPRAIRGVLSQTFRDLELIVVDDGSTDETSRVVAQFNDPRLVYLRQEARKGVAAARNAGLRASHAPLIAFQDSDDEWLIEKLTLQVAALQNAPAETGLLCSAYIVLAANGQVRCLGPTQAMQSGDWNRETIYDFCFIAPTWMVRREALVQVGAFDESLPNLEDWECAFRLFRKFRIVVLDRPLVVKHGSPDGLNEAKAARIRSLEMILDRYGDWWMQSPRTLARLHSELGRCRCLSGNLRAGRASFVEALRLEPTALKRWLHWFAAWTGPSGYARLLAMRG